MWNRMQVWAWVWKPWVRVEGMDGGMGWDVKLFVVRDRG